MELVLFYARLVRFHPVKKFPDGIGKQFLVLSSCNNVWQILDEHTFCLGYGFNERRGQARAGQQVAVGVNDKCWCSDGSQMTCRIVGDSGFYQALHAINVVV